MAVDSSSVSKRTTPAKKRVATTPQEEECTPEEGAPPSSQAKRNKSPGIRMVGRRVYDSVNGKTCHQCRQKTLDFVAACKGVRNNRPCPMMYCKKCLLNRYGEDAEKVTDSGDWICPKCKDNCNCSICMKKKGHQPTGMLINAAKATGFSSVSEMLSKGAEFLNQEKATDSSKKDLLPNMREKENTFDGIVDANSPNHAMSEEIKEGECMNNTDDTSLKIEADFSTTKNNEEILKGDGPPVNEKKTKKSRKKTGDGSDEANNTSKNNEVILQGDEKKPKKPKKPRKKYGDKSDEVKNIKNNAEILKSDGRPGDEKKPKKSRKKAGNDDGVKEDLKNKDNVIVEIPLPEGELLTNVAGIDFLPKDVGNALQFLQFCAVFGKSLNVKKGQAEHVLLDIFQGRSGRKGKFSVTIQIHINLLSIILNEQEEEEHITLSVSPGRNSWFNVLKDILSKSQSSLKAHGLDSLETVLDYDTLSASEKLKLLNILCDEALQTEKLKGCIEQQIKEQRPKRISKAREKVTALREKEREIRQKMRTGVPHKQGVLSIAERREIVSSMKRELEQAQSEVFWANNLLSKLKEFRSIIGIEPLFVGSDGQAYLKLKCTGDSTVLHQSVGNKDDLTFDDKWFTIDDEGKEAIKKHICSQSKVKRATGVKRKRSNVASTVNEANSIVSDEEGGSS